MRRRVQSLGLVAPMPLFVYPFFFLVVVVVVVVVVFYCGGGYSMMMICSCFVVV
jgi:hypothetical protein